MIYLVIDLFFRLGICCYFFAAQLSKKESEMQEIPFKIVPVLVLEELDIGLKMCECLCENGLPIAEITFRSEIAEKLIRETVKRFPEMLVGAGTILNLIDLKRAFDAGAKFAVTPGLNAKIVEEAQKCNYHFIPGVCTPSEIEQAYELGCRFLKFYPAEAAGGTTMLKSLIAPYKHLGIKFMPTGGLTIDKAAEYLAIPEVRCIGGTWLGKNIPDWKKVSETIRKAAEI